MRKLVIIKALITIQLIVYVLMAFLGTTKQISDASTYERILRELVLGGNIYPSGKYIFDNYINNPGSVNVYLLLWRVFDQDNIRVLFLFNALLIWGGNMILLRLLAKLNVSENRKIGFLIASIMYLSNIGLVNTISSDIMSYFLICITLYWVVHFSNYSKSRVYTIFGYVLIGVFFAFFDYVRPVGFICIFSFLFCNLIIDLRQKKLFLFNSIYKYISIVILFLCSKYLIGNFHLSYTDYKVNGSISLGYNILMGNGMDSDGSWTGGVYNDGGKGYFKEIKKTTADVKDKIWLKQAIDSIKLNPKYFLILGTRKLLLTFSYDVLALEKLTSHDLKEVNFNVFLNYFNLKLWDKFVIGLNNILYWFLFFIFLLKGINIFFIRHKIKNYIIFVYLLFLVYLALIFTVIGGARYHHILIPVFFIMTFLENKNIYNLNK